jgi:glycosyltransferase involved in cell wall biosynthesis
MSRVPRLSIGLPAYNGEKYLAEALEALLGQTYEDFELIISDNASTDGTADICRRYLRQDSRVKYLRQERNIGASPNQGFLLKQAGGELFKWAACDDLYARDLIERCVEALDEHPDVILAHCWTAAIDDTGTVKQSLEYPLNTSSPSAPERFRTMLFGTGGNDYGLLRADDNYGVMRTKVLRRVTPQGSYYHADRVFTTEIALHGRFYQVPEFLYFRRDHSDRPQHATPTVRGWCGNLDPRRKNKIVHPTARLLAEFPMGYVAAIQRAPLSMADRLECYRILAQWSGGRLAPVIRRMTGAGIFAGEPVPVPPPLASISVDKVVAGRGGVQS